MRAWYKFNDTAFSSTILSSSRTRRRAAARSLSKDRIIYNSVLQQTFNYRCHHPCLHVINNTEMDIDMSSGAYELGNHAINQISRVPNLSSSELYRNETHKTDGA